MGDGLLQGVASAFSVPFGALAEGAQTWASGRAAVLDLTVHHWEDSLSRQAVIRRFRRAGADERVAGIVLHLRAVPGNWAACQDFRDAILAVRQAGTCVYAAVETPGNAQMWLASACDRVFLVPTGEVSLVGVGAEVAFFGKLLERLGIETDFQAAGEYKSFGEPYTRSYASPENQEAIAALVQRLHEQLLDDVASGRRIEVEALRALVARAPLSAGDALAAGLVDQLCYADQMDDWLSEHHGQRARRLDFWAWARRDAAADWIGQWGVGASTIAVLHLDGPIVMDHPGPDAFIRARRVVPILKHLRELDRVRAVVLHVNSPGGHALASDLLWREVELLGRKKPVVASFEDVAASGGYYLAAPAREILARPTTLTGSIGVFGGKVVLGEAMRRVGVTTQAFLAAPNADVFSATRPFTADQRDRFRSSLQRFYDGFVQRVAAGRRAPAAALEPHCRGRVWTGHDALERGLVDRFGDLFDAIERARALAGLEHGGFRRHDLSAQPHRNLLSRAISAALRSLLPGGAGGAALEVLHRVAPISSGLRVVLESDGQALAMLPFEVEIR